MRLSRYWMTGCMALVLLAAGRWPMQGERDDSDLERRGWVTVSSPMSADEAVRKLKQAASRLGMPVMAQVRPSTSIGSQGESGSQVLVLGSSDGHTPIVQAEASSAMDVPLKVLVQSMPDGSSQVMYSSAQVWSDQAEVPAELLQDMAALPKVVQSALRPPSRQA